MKRLAALSALSALSVLAACSGGSPAPQAPSTTDRELSDENDALRGQVADLERRLARSEQREKIAAADARASEKLKKIDEKLSAIEKDLEKEPPVAPREAKRRPRPRPDASVTYSVPIDGGFSEGPASALVTIVVGTEIACPYCLKVVPSFDTLRKEYKRDLRVVYKSLVVHRGLAEPAAKMLCAATRQRKGRKMMNALWDQYRLYRDKGDRTHLSRATLLGVARANRLNVKRLERDMDKSCSAQIDRHHESFRKLGASGAPTIYINGRFMQGAQPIEKMRTLIDEELVKAKARVAAGVARKSLYAAIVAFGQTEM